MYRISKKKFNKFYYFYSLKLKSMTQVLESSLSDGLKVQYIDEMVALHGYRNITTSCAIDEGKVNIMTSNPNTLELILSKVYRAQLTITINDPTDTIILLS